LSDIEEPIALFTATFFRPLCVQAGGVAPGIKKKHQIKGGHPAKNNVFNKSVFKPLLLRIAVKVIFNIYSLFRKIPLFTGVFPLVVHVAGIIFATGAI
jgi:hypothetical protein